jgi:hypothetical protein
LATLRKTVTLRKTQCCGSALVSMGIRIQLFISMRVWIGIQDAKPIRIHADPVPDHGQTLKEKKVGFFYEKIYLK